MLQQLPETGETRERRWRWMMPSIALHVAIITAIAFAPARGTEVPKAPIAVDTTLIYTAPADRHGAPGTTVPRGNRRTVGAPLPPAPTNLDPPAIPGPTVDIWRPIGPTVGVGDFAARPDGQLASGPGGTVGEAIADEPVRVRTESVPRYPTALREMGVDGVVEMEFVVDTAGRAIVERARVLSSTDERFTIAVRAALRDTRFVPGRYQGRAVQTLVKRAFHFALETRR